MVWKASTVIGLVGSFLWLSSALAEPPQLAIDTPSQGQHTSGLCSILGRAVGITAPIDFVEVSFDGGNPIPVGYGGARGDVGDAFLPMGARYSSPTEHNGTEIPHVSSSF